MIVDVGWAVLGIFVNECLGRMVDEEGARMVAIKNEAECESVWAYMSLVWLWWWKCGLRVEIDGCSALPQRVLYMLVTGCDEIVEQIGSSWVAMN